MKRNTITIIELVIVICVIVVSVRIWTYKKPDSKPTPIPTPEATPAQHPLEEHYYSRQMSTVIAYYNDCKRKFGREKAVKKTIDWINKKSSSSELIVPDCMKRAYAGIDNECIFIEFNDGMLMALNTEDDTNNDLTF